jgi:hypothetical protein
MNWRVSSLDRYRLASNSDAHSPGKLGREATRFSCEPDFFAMRRALETGEGYEGTVEFFPQEGKYHLDGHRACGVRLDPAETIAHDGRCPVCGNRVTFGVAHRVEMLADRKEADALPPPTAGAVTSLVPLPEILSEIVGGGVASQGVARAYDRTTAALGSDFAVLEEAPVEDIAKVNPLLGEAVDRLRAGAVIRQAGYDGEYGVIRLFEEGELDRLIRIHAIDIVQPPGIGISPIADMDAHQAIVTAALAAKSSAETPKKARWEARSETIAVEISRPPVAPTAPTTWLSACRTCRGGATRRPSRYAPWGHGRATGTCPRGRPVRAHRRNRCGRRRRPRARTRSCPASGA